MKEQRERERERKREIQETRVTEIRACKGYDLGGGSRVGLKDARARARFGKSTDLEDS